MNMFRKLLRHNAKGAGSSEPAPVHKKLKQKIIEYLQLKSVIDTRYGRSVHNASEFYDEIRRDTRSETDCNNRSTYLKQQIKDYLEVSDHERIGKIHCRRKNRAEV